jgi:hypothetical protein
MKRFSQLKPTFRGDTPIIQRPPSGDGALWWRAELIQLNGDTEVGAADLGTYAEEQAAKDRAADWERSGPGRPG